MPRHKPKTKYDVDAYDMWIISIISIIHVEVISKLKYKHARRRFDNIIVLMSIKNLDTQIDASGL